MKSQAECEALRRNVDGVAARDAHVHQMGAPEYLNIFIGYRGDWQRLVLNEKHRARLTAERG